MLYDSLHEKLLTLPDAIVVYPAHGAGSLCGRNISSETSSTIGQQRRFNYALQPMTREDFVALMTADLPEAPAYFSRDARLNREGAAAASPRCRAPPALSPGEVASAAGGRRRRARRARVGRVRHRPRSRARSTSGSVGPVRVVGRRPAFPPRRRSSSWPRTRSASPRRERAWRAWASRTSRATWPEGSARGTRRGGRSRGPSRSRVDELRGADRARARDLTVLDVRRPGEWQAGHIAQAVQCRFTSSRSTPRRSTAGRPVAVICASGYRSSIATSLLERPRLPAIHQRRRRHDGLERGEAGSQHAVVEDREARCGSRDAGRGWRSSLRDPRGVAGARRRRRNPPAASGSRASRHGSSSQPGQKDEVFNFADGYKSYLNVSRSAQTSTREVDAPGEGGRLRGVHGSAGQVKPGARLIVNGRDRAVILVVVGSEPIVSGSRVIGTHHDSPHIDLKARPIYTANGFTLFKTIYYGGIKKYQWANRAARADRPHRHGGRQARRRGDRAEGGRSRLRDPRQRAALGRQGPARTARTRTSSAAKSSIRSRAAFPARALR